MTNMKDLARLFHGAGDALSKLHEGLSTAFVGGRAKVGKTRAHKTAAAPVVAAEPKADKLHWTKRPENADRVKQWKKNVKKGARRQREQKA